MSQSSFVGIITGGANGLGRGMVYHFLLQGDSILIVDVDDIAAKEVCEEYKDLKGQVKFFKADVSKEEDVKSSVDACINEYGRIDFVVNNAAIAYPYTGKLDNLSLDTWNKVIGINLTGPMLYAKHAARHLRTTKGAIINIASTRALMSEPDSEAYAASKGGLVSLTHALAMSLGPDVLQSQSSFWIRVNCICPGWIEVRDWQRKSKKIVPSHNDTDRNQHAVGRIGVPEDIASLVEFLANAKTAGFITGQNFVVDGGMTKKMIYEEAKW